MNKQTDTCINVAFGEIIHYEKQLWSVYESVSSETIVDRSITVRATRTGVLPSNQIELKPGSILERYSCKYHNVKITRIEGNTTSEIVVDGSAING